MQKGSPESIVVQGSRAFYNTLQGHAPYVVHARHFNRKAMAGQKRKEEWRNLDKQEDRDVRDKITHIPF
jgi:hypothetical protein